MNHVNHVWVVEKQRDNGEWDITYLPENPDDNTEKFMRYMVVSAPDDEPRRVRRYVDAAALLEAAEALLSEAEDEIVFRIDDEMFVNLRKAIADIEGGEG